MRHGMSAAKHEILKDEIYKAQRQQAGSKLLPTMAKVNTAASKGKLHVLWLYSGPLCVDGAEVDFLENLNQVHFRGLLHPQSRG